MFSEVDTKGFKITDDEINQFQYVTDFIRTKGYNVSLTTDLIPVNVGRSSLSPQGGGNQSDSGNSNNQNSQTNLNGDTGKPSNSGISITSRRPPFAPPTVYLDGAKLFDFSPINRMLMNIVDEVYFDFNGLSSGIMAGSGQGGIIYIITKKGSIGGYSNQYNPVNQEEVIVNNGFNPPEKYNTPNYTDLDNPVFQKYGALDWKAFLTTDDNGKSVITLRNRGFKNVKLFIEGVSMDGKVISWIQDIQIR